MSTLFPAILVPLDGSHIAARSLGCATWLASRLGARLHILSATAQELPARDELVRLNIPAKHWPLITLHQAPAYPAEAILAAVARHEVSLVIMTSRGETAETAAADEPAPSKIIGRVARAIVERSAVPVLLLPQNYREALPWERMLVPLSGETDVDEALLLAVRLANALGIEVHVAHVADAEAGGESLSARARYADALHHEYPRQLEEFVRRALPQCTPDECRCIIDVALCHGDIVKELLQLIERKRVSLIVVGWHGRLLNGRAQVLTEMIHAISIPVLLVKAEPRTTLRLKVGEEIE
jgi:nucleotide-binding universal stress UspA family protein